MPSVYSDTLTHDAVLVWLSPQDRDAVGGVQMRTAPPPAVSDDVPVTDQVTVQVGLALAVADSTPGTEALAFSLPLLPQVADAVAPGEAVAGRLSVLLPTVGDDRLATEAVTVSLVLPGVSVVDALVPTDAVELRASLVVVDTLTPSDAAAVALPTAPTAVDVVVPTEAVVIALNVLTLSISDAIPVGELVSPLAHVTLNVADILTIDERRFASFKVPKKVHVKGGPPGQAVR